MPRSHFLYIFILHSFWSVRNFQSASELFSGSKHLHICAWQIKKSRPANLCLPRCFAIGAWATRNSKLEITKTKNANPRCAGGRASGVHICTRAGLFVLLPFLMVRAWVVLFANRESHPGSKSSPLMNIARELPPRRLNRSFSPRERAHERTRGAARWWIAALQKEFQTLSEYIYSTSAAQLAHLKGESFKSLAFWEARDCERYIRALLSAEATAVREWND